MHSHIQSYTFIRSHSYKHAHTHVHTCTNMYIDTHTHANTHAHICTYTLTHIHAHTHASLCSSCLIYRIRNSWSLLSPPPRTLPPWGALWAPHRVLLSKRYSRQMGCPEDRGVLRAGPSPVPNAVGLQRPRATGLWGGQLGAAEGFASAQGPQVARRNEGGHAASRAPAVTGPRRL